MLLLVVNTLARAEAPPPESTNLGTMLLCIVVFAGAAILAFFPIRNARVRGHRFSEAILALGILWACLAAASVIFPLMARAQFAADHYAAMMMGGSDPNDMSGQPAWPWLIWTGLAAGYAVLFFVSLRGEKVEVPPAEL